MNRFRRGSRWLLVFAPALMVSSACSRQGGVSADSSSVTSRQAASAQPSKAPTVQHVLLAAANYKFDGDSEPILTSYVIRDHGNNKHIPVTDDPKMTIAAAIWHGPGSEPANEQIVALVDAKHMAYPGLGVLPNRNNYLWRSRSNASSPWAVWMVPAYGHGPIQLVSDGHSYSQGNPKRPRLMYQGFPPPLSPSDSAASKMFTTMVLGICVEDQMCGGHCGYTR